MTPRSCGRTTSSRGCETRTTVSRRCVAHCLHDPHRRIAQADRSPTRILAEHVVRPHATTPSSQAARERFVEYRRSGDRRIRDELLEAHVGLAAYLARRFLNRVGPFDELRQVALVGLFKAVERFEPERGVQFSTFATPTIVGELKRHFRDRAWAVRVPRRVQEIHLHLRATISEYSQEHGRSPTPAELATTAELPIDKVVEALAANDIYRLRRSTP